MNALLTAAILAASTITQPSAPIAPSGKWLVDYADGMCVLSRNYGESAEEKTLGFKPSPLGGYLEVVLLVPKPGAQYRSGKGKLVLQPSGHVVEGQYISVRLPEGKNFTKITSDEDAFGDLKASTTVGIALGGDSRIDFAVPGMDRALHALQACQDDLVKSWGLDPAEREHMLKPATSASPADWISTNDYPPEASSRGIQGTSMILWSVTTEGRVADCRTVHSSGNVSLDTAACYAITARGRYKPAIGLDGKPMVSHQSRNVVWRLPG